MLLNLREIGDVSSNDTYLEMEHVSAFKAGIPQQSNLAPTSRASTTLRWLSDTGGCDKQTTADKTGNRSIIEELSRASKSHDPDSYDA